MYLEVFVILGSDWILYAMIRPHYYFIATVDIVREEQVGGRIIALEAHVVSWVPFFDPYYVIKAIFGIIIL